MFFERPDVLQTMIFGIGQEYNLHNIQACKVLGPVHHDICVSRKISLFGMDLKMCI